MKPANAAARAHRRVEETLARAMRAADPVRVLRAAGRDRGLPGTLRRACAAVDADGVRVAALLVARLRFERLLRGSPEAEAWFERDAAGFTVAFRSYHRQVAPTAFSAAGEAALFRAFTSRRRRPAG